MAKTDPAILNVAIIGGGIAGSVSARELSNLASGKLSITVFDQGRLLGGRAAHRRVEENGEYLSSTAEAAFVFDHGCQFFRADSHQFQHCLLQDWLARGWVAEWQGKFGILCGPGGDKPHADFFGFPNQPPYYCGFGGMSALPCALLEDATASGSVRVCAGVRVAGTAKLASGKWLLSGTSGKAAFHDTAEEEAARVSPDALGEFDAVIVTDVSASMPGWHRASAGIPEEIASRVRNRTRVCLFTALFAFSEPLDLEEDAFSALDDTLWFASRTRSKPGLANAAKYDCWTLVSTPKYAAAEIERVPMQDPKTGAFRPQDMSYLRDGPCAELLAAFERLLTQNGRKTSLPKTVYVGGQRWGSAFPAPLGIDGRDSDKGRGPLTVEVMSVAYDSAASISLAPDHTRRINMEAEEVFNRFDIDSSGSIDFQELRDKMLELGFMMDDEELHQMIADVDKNKNGKIEFPEFLNLLKRDQYSSFAARLLKADPKEVVVRSMSAENVDATCPEPKRPRLSRPALDFLADDERRIYYTSDYVSTYLPGLEASALSALKTARHVATVLLGQRAGGSAEL